MNTLAQIKDWAELGWNQGDVSQALGLTRYKLQLFIREHGYRWPKCKSIAFRERAKRWKPIGDPENVTRLNEARQSSLERYTVRGVTGTRRELIDQFAVVPAHTVDVRITRGWTMEDALFTPARSKPADSHPWREPWEENV